MLLCLKASQAQSMTLVFVCACMCVREIIPIMRVWMSHPGCQCRGYIIISLFSCASLPSPSLPPSLPIYISCSSLFAHSPSYCLLPGCLPYFYLNTPRTLFLTSLLHKTPGAQIFPSAPVFLSSLLSFSHSQIFSFIWLLGHKKSRQIKIQREEWKNEQFLKLE